MRVLIKLDGLPTRRLLGDAVTAAPVGVLSTQIVAVIKFDTKRSFLMLDIEIIAIFLCFGIPDKCACAKIK